LKPFLFLAGLGFLYFAPLLFHPTQVLYSDHSDFLGYCLTVEHFLVRSWQQTGEIPLWCPYSFGGMPFVHDVQVTAFYPLHLPLYLLSEEWLGVAMSWLVVVHVIVAGWCMYGYSRHRELDPTPALVAAVGYMFAGKALLHELDGGHYHMLPLAWLPLVLLWLEQAISQCSLRRATRAGAAFALIVLGAHPQLTFFAGLFIALWTAGSAETRTRWLAMGTWSALVAVALTAVQLLPALEAAPESTRAVGVTPSDAAAVALPTLMGLIGPGWRGGWEDRGGLGPLWLAAAVAAPLLCGGRVRFQAGVCLMLVFFSAGGAALLQWLPGFRLFQLPVRMLMLLALPIALLAGQTTQALLAQTPAPAHLGGICRRALLWALGTGLILAALAGSIDYRAFQDAQQTAAAQSADRGPPSDSFSEWLQQVDVRVPAYWGVVLVAAVAALWLLNEKCPLNPRAWACAWLAVLLADSWALTWFNVAVRPADEVYAPSACIRYLAEMQRSAPQDHWRVLDRGLPGLPSSAPLGAALPFVANVEIEPVLGCNPLDLRRYKEFLQFIMDEDAPIRPRVGIFGYPIVQAFPIRNKSLLDLLGTRYLLESCDGITCFDAAGEPGRNQSWQATGPVDPQPKVFSFLAGGMQELPPYRIYENLDAFPRAFVVHRALPLADQPQVLSQMKSTDFRREVLLEGSLPQLDSDPFPPVERFDSATIREYLPNRVAVETRTELPGYLVLTDVWFPGWTCTVDGQPAPIHRANFLFRAVALPAGNHEVRFVFDPGSYRWGRRISVMALIAVLGFSLPLGNRKKATH
jgi:hypothetical protein